MKRSIQMFAMLVGILLTSAVVPALAQAEDRCLVGRWEHYGPVINALTGEEMPPAIGDVSVALTFPSPTAGAATLYASVYGYVHVIDIPGFTGTAEEPYDVTSPSTPAAPGGSLNWTSPVAINPGVVLPILPGGYYEEIHEAPASGAYSCTATTLSISVPLAFVGPITFNRTGPPLQPATLQVINQGTGTGTVTSSPHSGIACRPSCSTSVWQGTQLSLTALRIASSFMGWGGPCTPLVPLSWQAGNVLGERECQVTTSAPDAVVTATFGYPLDVTITGAGIVTGQTTGPPPPGFPAPATIDCASVCGAYYAQAVTLTAAPAHGYALLGWTGPCSRPRPHTCQLSMTATSPVTAIFAAKVRTLPKLEGSLRRSFRGRRYSQTSMRPRTTLWRGENEVLPGVGSHRGAGYFGLQQPTTSAQAQKLYNLAIWKNNAQCLQEYEVTEVWRAYIGGVAAGAGTQVLAPVVHGRALTIRQLLKRGWITTVGRCVPLPLV